MKILFVYRKDKHHMPYKSSQKKQKQKHDEVNQLF